METKFEAEKIAIYNDIRNNATKKSPISSTRLCAEYGIPFRRLKEIITELRKEYPIVAKETDGGGYWVAESTDDIIEFIAMIERRKKGYEDTIETMDKFLQVFAEKTYID